MTERFGIPLVTEELIDCSGDVTHRLVLEIDGTVSITFVSSGVTARVNPTTREVLTPGVHVPPPLMDQAASMRLA
jgi:hypothetical protein